MLTPADTAHQACMVRIQRVERPGETANRHNGSLCHSNDYVALFVTSFDIAVRLDDLLERIDPVNGRFHLARLDQFFEHEQVFERIAAVGVGMDVDMT